MKVIISDTSPIRALQQIGLLHLLGDLFGSVIIPPAVRDELKRFGFSTLPGFIEVKAPTDRSQVSELTVELDPGEAEAIALAIELRADLLLVDERRATSIAASRGVQTIGVLGLLVQSKREGLIPAVGPVISELKSKARFFIADDLVARVLKIAGEGPKN
jgi:uncharacterized protein